MQIGFIGLGKMGQSMVKRLLIDKHEIIVFDLNKDAVKTASKNGAQTADSIEGLVQKISEPRVIWVMVPSGKPTGQTIQKLSSLLNKEDVIIDGGNSFYKDSVRHTEELATKGIYFLDAGTSGGVWGLQIGYCLMIGGEKTAFAKAEPIFKTLAPKEGYLHVGPGGSGHFVKMVHNGIEYAMLQSYGEGFEILKEKKEFALNLKEIAHLWNQGSVVRSWLLELVESAFNNDPQLKSIKGYVEDSGEGRWTVAAAIEENVPAPTITQALFERFRSRQTESFSSKLIAALRNEFGGHGVKKN